MYINSKNNTFTSFDTDVHISLNQDFETHSVADFNGDGIDDILLRHYVEYNCYGMQNNHPPVGFFKYYVLYCDANGSFFDSSIKEDGSLDTIYADDFIVGDVNGDGMTDIVGYNRLNGAFTVFFSDGVGFRESANWSQGTADDSWSSAVVQTNAGTGRILRPGGKKIINLSGDFNGDGKTDIFHNDLGRFKVLISNGSGFEPVKEWTDYTYSTTRAVDIYNHEDQTILASNEESGYSVFDVNGDGFSDIVLSINRDLPPEVHSDDGDSFSLSSAIQRKYAVSYSDGSSFSVPTSDLPYADTLQNDQYGFPTNPWAVCTGNIYPQNSDHHMFMHTFADFNGDGMVDHLSLEGEHFGTGAVFEEGDRTWRLYLNNESAIPDRLVSIIDNLGKEYQIQYDKVTNPVIYTRGTTTVYPIKEVINGCTEVVGRILNDIGVDSNGDGILDEEEAEVFSYHYSGRRTDLSGRGDLGFHSFVTMDHQTDLFKATSINLLS